MDSLKDAVIIAEIIVAVALAVIIGDYLGYKFGHARVAAISAITALAAILVFAVYAAIKLNLS